jgi:hypothetical protein
VFALVGVNLVFTLFFSIVGKTGEYKIRPYNTGEHKVRPYRSGFGSRVISSLTAFKTSLPSNNTA